jgi:phage baseplate assembly protein W
MAATKQFIDLDLNFTPHPVSKDITKRINESAIKASLKNLLLTGYYERPFHSEIGSPIRQLLFELATPVTRELIKRAIHDIVLNFERRVTLTNVEVRFNDDNNSVDVVVEFKILNSINTTTLDLTLERTR